MWPARLYQYLLHYLINGTIFLEKIIEQKMCIVIFSTTVLQNVIHSKKN